MASARMTSLPSSLATHTVRASTRLTPLLRQHLLTLCHKGSRSGGHRGDLGSVALSGTLRRSDPARPAQRWRPTSRPAASACPASTWSSTRTCRQAHGLPAAVRPDRPRGRQRRDDHLKDARASRDVRALMLKANVIPLTATAYQGSPPPRSRRQTSRPTAASVQPPAPDRPRQRPWPPAAAAAISADRVGTTGQQSATRRMRSRSAERP
jgi:hypothetical protein